MVAALPSRIMLYTNRQVRRISLRRSLQGSRRDTASGLARIITAGCGKFLPAIAALRLGLLSCSISGYYQEGDAGIYRHSVWAAQGESRARGEPAR